MTKVNRELDDLCVNTLRFLSADAIQQANSGHPGLPLGAAAMAHVLYTRHLKHHPVDPQWADRDRFVLSAGHGSALLYSLLHLSGYDVSLSDLRAFRQWESRTPGHPESHVTSGVEATTGPLGQGIANAVGLAIGERHLAAVFNRSDTRIVDHYTYALVGDGDLMEGISYEAMTLAGRLELGKLIVLFDSNEICLAGSTHLSTAEDMPQRFASCGWHVATVEDGNDLEAIDEALARAKREEGKPSLVIVKTVIGYGAPTKQNSYKVHGAPLGEEELSQAKIALGWPYSESFVVPEEVSRYYEELRDGWRERHAEWSARFEGYRAARPDLAAEFERRQAGALPEGWASALPTFEAAPDGPATRKASEAVLQAAAGALPELIGGSADLNPSTYTWLKGFGDFQAPCAAPARTQGAVGPSWDYGGRNIHFGVREHAMGAIVNGMARHGGLIPYAATFLVFSDYMRAPIRLAALSGYRSIFVFTHDSICVGEDGPTHQPVEQLMSLRLIPNLVVLRPADANETREAWRIALERSGGPTALVFSRQGLPTLDRAVLGAAAVDKGAYVLYEPKEKPQAILIASGSEVSLCLSAAQGLAGAGVAARVVSVPSMELFDAQPAAYREDVLPAGIWARVAVEAGSTMGWRRYAGDRGAVIGLDRFGASAPGGEAYAKLGFTEARIVETVHAMLGDSS